VKPLDPRLIRRSHAARRFLVAGALLAAVQAAAIIAFAWALASLVAGLIDGMRMPQAWPLIGILVVAASARAVGAWGWDVVGSAGAMRVKAELRGDLLGALETRPGGVPGFPTSRIATLLGPGLEALDEYFGRYLPQLVLTVVATSACVVAVWVADPLSGLVLVIVLPLIPVFMALIGMATGAVQRRQWESLASLSRGFLEVVGGLSTLILFGRADRQVERIRAVTDDYPPAHDDGAADHLPLGVHPRVRREPLGRDRRRVDRPAARRRRPHPGARPLRARARARGLPARCATSARPSTRRRQGSRRRATRSTSWPPPSDRRTLARAEPSRRAVDDASVSTDDRGSSSTISACGVETGWCSTGSTSQSGPARSSRSRGRADRASRASSPRSWASRTPTGTLRLDGRRLDGDRSGIAWAGQAPTLLAGPSPRTCDSATRTPTRDCSGARSGSPAWNWTPTACSAPTAAASRGAGAARRHRARDPPPARPRRPPAAARRARLRAGSRPRGGPGCAPPRARHATTGSCS
jgi:hypothetical protein